jgi:thiol:disulfide interchange protein DsbC
MTVISGNFLCYTVRMRRFFFICFIAALVLSGRGHAAAFDKCDQACDKCHTLSLDQAKEVFKQLGPNIDVLGVHAGPIKGLWEVDIESGGRKNVVYVDFSKKKVIAGNIVDIKTKRSYTQESLQQISKVDFASIPLGNSVVMGDKNAKYKIIVFDDPE